MYRTCDVVFQSELVCGLDLMSGCSRKFYEIISYFISDNKIVCRTFFQDVPEVLTMGVLVFIYISIVIICDASRTCDVVFQSELQCVNWT